MLKATGRIRRAPALAVLSLAAILTGCSSASDLDVFGIFDDGPAATTTTGQAKVRASGDQESAAASAQPTPTLSSVPPRPDAPTSPSVRQRVVKGLVADRENARYSDETIRLQGTRRETVAAAPTTTPPPPQISASSNGGVGAPTQVLPRPPIETARATPPPAPPPLATGPRPSVEVDATAIDGSPSFPIRATQVTIDEQVATIHFAHSSSKLDDRDRSVIAAIASEQQKNNAEVVVVGHASGRTQQLDKVEHELANFRISLARANRVASQLVAMGVAREKVRVEAFADSSQLYSETMPTGEAGNRRADIYFRQ